LIVCMHQSSELINVDKKAMAGRDMRASVFGAASQSPTNYSR